MSILLLGAGPQSDFLSSSILVSAFVNLATDGATPMDQVLRFIAAGSLGNGYRFTMQATVGTPGITDSLSALTFSYKDGISSVGDLENFLPSTHVVVVSGSASPSTVLSSLGAIDIAFHGGH